MQTERQADSLDLCPSLDVSAEQTSCLTTAFFKISTSLCVLTVFCYESMPKLKETYRQIQERNAREIKQRTRERIRALHEEEGFVFVEDLPEPSIVIAEQSYLVPVLLCIIVILVLVCLLLTQQICLAKKN